MVHIFVKTPYQRDFFLGKIIGFSHSDLNETVLIVHYHGECIDYQEMDLEKKKWIPSLKQVFAIPFVESQVLDYSSRYLSLDQKPLTGQL
jgi:hypothetical protein